MFHQNQWRRWASIIVLKFFNTANIKFITLQLLQKLQIFIVTNQSQMCDQEFRYRKALYIKYYLIIISSFI